MNSFYLFTSLFLLSNQIYYQKITDEKISIAVKNYQYFVFNLISCACFMLTFIAGRIRERLEFLHYISMSFMSLYLVQKAFEFPWLDEKYSLVVFFVSSFTILSIVVIKKRMQELKEKEEWKKKFHIIFFF